jgi:hypothetical protein
VPLPKQDRNEYLIAVGGAALGLLLAANIGFEFGLVTTAPDQPLDRYQSIRQIEAANYCAVSSDCIMIRGGDWSDGQCRWGNILVNAAEAHRMPQLCDMAIPSRLYFIHSEAPSGMDRPQCVAGRCVPGQ